MNLNQEDLHLIHSRPSFNNSTISELDDQAQTKHRSHSTLSSLRLLQTTQTHRICKVNPNNYKGTIQIPNVRLTDSFMSQDFPFLNTWVVFLPGKRSTHCFSVHIILFVKRSMSKVRDVNNIWAIAPVLHNLLIRLSKVAFITTAISTLLLVLYQFYWG